ncbi:MAG: transposase [Pseudomonadota bacterium]
MAAVDIPPSDRTFFCTVRLAQEGGDLLVRHVDILRGAVRYVKRLKRIEIVSWVTLPDHFHCVLTLAPDMLDPSNVIGGIKARFSLDARRAGLVPQADPNPKADDVGIWQKGFRHRHLSDATDVARHISMCNLDAVKHGLVTDPFDWPHCSIHRDMRLALQQGAARANRLAPVGRRIVGAHERRGDHCALPAHPPRHGPPDRSVPSDCRQNVAE